MGPHRPLPPFPLLLLHLLAAMALSQALSSCRALVPRRPPLALLRTRAAALRLYTATPTHPHTDPPRQALNKVFPPTTFNPSPWDPDFTPYHASFPLATPEQWAQLAELASRLYDWNAKVAPTLTLNIALNLIQDSNVAHDPKSTRSKWG